MTVTTLYANPYDISKTGFYFTSTDDYQLQMQQASFEEVEIDYIDGDNPKLFEAAGINQSNLDQWFNELDSIDDDSTEGVSIIFLLGFMDLKDAISRYEEVIIWFGSAEDYAAELLADITDLDQLPEIIKYHIDYSGIARDMELSSEITEVSSNTWVTNCLEF
jgi:hypothetical protein